MTTLLSTKEAAAYTGFSRDTLYRENAGMSDPTDMLTTLDVALEVATVRVEHFDTLEALVTAERAAIKAENPRYNVRGR